MLSAIYNRTCRAYVSRLVAEEISAFSRYYDGIFHLLPLDHDNGSLFHFIQSNHKTVIGSIAELPAPCISGETRHAVLLNGNLNHTYDVQELLENIKTNISRADRIVGVVYNSYLRYAYVLAGKLGIRGSPLPTTFLTQKNLVNIANISGYEVVRVRPVAYFPFQIFGLGTLVNKLLQALPLLRWLAFAQVVIFRPLFSSGKRPSLSIVIPARNEAGNIENALKRMPNLNTEIEVIFVEGHSQDNTWAEIQRIAQAYGDKFKIQTHRQSGKGKNDAVRLGFARATHELLTILDADLTMPPELLQRFYEAYVEGRADFINGSRLVYPMEGEAMRFFNWIGNNFFARALSWVLDTNLGDSLCGTKLLRKSDYLRLCRWRVDFGDFDPFGDFEMLFFAAVLGLGIVDIPIRYRSRTYGTTNIHRFRHGLILFKMTLIGFCRIRIGGM